MTENDNQENMLAETAAGAEKTGNIKTESKKERVYELGFLLLSTISEENVPGVFGDIKELILSQGGEIISSEMPRLIHLAYVMEKTIENVKKKFDTAYFSWIKFQIQAGSLAGIKKQLSLNPEIIRFLLQKTVRENTLAPRKFNRSASMRYRGSSGSKEEKEESMPIDKEKIDEEIEALVTETA